MTAANISIPVFSFLNGLANCLRIHKFDWLVPFNWVESSHLGKVWSILLRFVNLSVLFLFIMSGVVVHCGNFVTTLVPPPPSCLWVSAILFPRTIHFPPSCLKNGVVFIFVVPQLLLSRRVRFGLLFHRFLFLKHLFG